MVLFAEYGIKATLHEINDLYCPVERHVSLTPNEALRGLFLFTA
jgi:hypothetical protein